MSDEVRRGQFTVTAKSVDTAWEQTVWSFLKKDRPIIPLRWDVLIDLPPRFLPDPFYQKPPREGWRTSWAWIWDVFLYAWRVEAGIRPRSTGESWDLRGVRIANRVFGYEP